VDDLDWEDALAELRHSGWDVEEIDTACAALVDACCEGDLQGTDIRDLGAKQVRRLIGQDLEAREREMLLLLCDVYDREDEDGAALRDVLSDGELFGDEDE
jgi:hypothetical protein